MSENVVRELKSVDDSGKFYSHVTFCGNCGERNYCYVRRGHGLTGKRIECDKCGCGISLRSNNDLWRENAP